MTKIKRYILKKKSLNKITKKAVEVEPFILKYPLPARSQNEKLIASTKLRT